MPLPSNPPPPQGGPAAAMQGLGAARPAPAAPQGAGAPPDPQKLVQIVGAVLQELTQRYGPGVIDILKKILSGPAQGAGPGAGAPHPPQAGGATVPPGPLQGR